MSEWRQLTWRWLVGGYRSANAHCDETLRIWNRTRKFKNWLKSKNLNIYRSKIGPLFKVFMTLLDVESEGWIEREEMARSKGHGSGSNPSCCSAVVWSPAHPLSSAGTQTDGCQRSKLVLNPTRSTVLEKPQHWAAVLVYYFHLYWSELLIRSMFHIYLKIEKSINKI